MDWSSYYPAHVGEATSEDSTLPKPLTKDVEVVDIGCGFGGLLVALAPLLPETLMLGMYTNHRDPWEWPNKPNTT